MTLPLSLPRSRSLSLSLFPVLTAPAFRPAFGVPASPHRRGRVGGELEGLRPRRWDAGGLLLGRSRRPQRSSRGSPVRHCAGRTACRRVDPAQCRTRHPDGARISAGPGRLRSRFPIRLGGHCGGGLPACPSGVLKPVARFRESAGYQVLWELRFLTPSAPAFRPAVTRWRPGGPASPHRRGRAWGFGEGCDPADGTPAACFVAGAEDPQRSSRGSPVRHCAGRTACRRVDPAQCRTRHPEGARISACPHRLRSRFPIRLGGHCGGGLPACPSGVLKPAARFRESAGYRVLWELRFLTPSAPAFRPAVTRWRPGGPASPHRRSRVSGELEGLRPRRWDAGCLLRGRSRRPQRSSRGSPVRHCAQRTACRRVDPAQCRTRHPDGARISACPHRLRSRFPIRLGGHCGGGLPACPSGVLKPAARFRESAGYRFLWELRFLTPSAPAFRPAVTRWRPGGPASPHRRGRVGGELEGLRPRRWDAGGLLRGRSRRPQRSSRGSTVRHCAGRTACRRVDPAQCRTRHPEGARISACPHRLRSRFPIRLGGHCGGGLPACPSGVLKPAARFRESAGYRVLWELRFLTPSAPAFRPAVTRWPPGGPASPHRRGRVGGELAGLRPRRWDAGGLLRGRSRRPQRSSRGSPVRHCAGRTACRRVDPAQCRTRHPEGRFFPSDPGRRLTLPLPPTGWKPVATQRPFLIV